MDLFLAGALDDDDDLCLLTTLLRNQPPPLTQYRLDVDSLDDSQCLSLFRFLKDDLIRLKTALRIPERIVGPNKTVATGLEGLCILLRRLTYPNRLEDLISDFGRSKSELSIIINEVLDHIYSNFGHLIQTLDKSWLQQEHLQVFSDAVHQHGAPLSNCWGFIDGTVRPVSRPIQSQRLVFSGHKRVHALKFQSVTTPNGLVAHMFGPVEGRRHDAAMLAESGLLPELQRLPNSPPGHPYYVYGDPAYPLRQHLLKPFSGARLSPEELDFYKRMSSVRECVEWSFGKIITYFAFLDFKKNLKIFLQPVAKYYLVGTLLTNCHTCLYGSQTGTYFNLQPPTLKQYLND